MESKEISFENLPKAVAFLSDQIAEIKQIVKNQNSISEPEKRIPIDIETASRIIGKAKPTIYTWFASAKFRAIKMVRNSIFLKMN